LNGAYPPQASIPTEPELIGELGVSRTVLREAIKVLAAKGLIESRTKSGTRVRPRTEWNLLDPMILHLYCQVVDYSDFAQNFQQLRAVIEPEAAALAAANHTGRQLRVLEAAYAAMVSAQNVEQWTTADLRFHEAILDATGNPFMRPLGALIRAALETLLFHSAQSSANPFDSLGVHERVLEAIRKREAATARLAMKNLLANTALSISKTVRTERGRSGRISPTSQLR
jgi:DNA-binding FadR family transcriptional regulator